MKKILILANNDVGLYKFRKELIQELIHRGNKVYISLPDGEYVQDLIDMGCIFYDTNVDRRGINPFKDFRLLLEYVRMIREIKPEFVITYTVKPNVYGGMVARLLKVPYAINITGLGTTFQNDGMLKKLVILLYKMACKASKVVFFENDENRQIFLNEKIVKEEQTCLLNGAGVNIEEYQYIDYPDENEPVRFLFIGRVMKEKGVDELFEVAKRIKKEYPEVIFDIVGPFEDDYENIIAELVKGDVIKYHGFQKDVKPFIEKCSCFVLPSYHEGMANTNLECASSGRPLITSNIHGCLEAVENRTSGYLCEPKNVEDLHEKIKMFIDLSWNDKKNMGIEGRKRIEILFDKKKIVKKTVSELFK